MQRIEPAERLVDLLFLLGHGSLGLAPALLLGLQVQRDILPLERAQHHGAQRLLEALVVVGAGRLEDGLDVAHARSHRLQLRGEQADHTLLERACNDDVQDLDRAMRASQSLDAADALFEPHGIPRQVDVDQHVGGLEVHAFRTGVGAHDDLHLRRVGLEGADVLGVSIALAAADGADREALALEQAHQHGLRLAAAGEDHGPERGTAGLAQCRQERAEHAGLRAARRVALQRTDRIERLGTGRLASRHRLELGLERLAAGGLRLQQADLGQALELRRKVGHDAQDRALGRRGIRTLHAHHAFGEDQASVRTTRAGDVLRQDPAEGVDLVRPDGPARCVGAVRALELSGLAEGIAMAARRRHAIDQAVEVPQPILHGRCREHEHERKPSCDQCITHRRRHGRRLLGIEVSKAVGLVEDEHVEGPVGHLRQPAPGGLVGRDHQRYLRCHQFVELGARTERAGDAELRLHFLGPLGQQDLWRQHERAPDALPHHELAQHQPSADRLAQADVIRQQRDRQPTAVRDEVAHLVREGLETIAPRCTAPDVLGIPDHDGVGERPFQRGAMQRELVLGRRRRQRRHVERENAGLKRAAHGLDPAARSFTA